MFSRNRLIAIGLCLLVLVQLACGIGGSQAPVPTTAPPAAPTQAGQPTAAAGKPTVTSAPASTSAPAATPAVGALNLPAGIYTYSNANTVRGLAFYKGKVYAATLGGVVAWDLASGKPQKFIPKDGLKHISTYDVKVCAMPDDRLVVGTRTGVSLFNPASQTWDPSPLLAEAPELETAQIYKVYCDAAAKRLLINPWGVGVYDFGARTWKAFGDKDGLPFSTATDMASRGEVIWAVSNYKGVVQISGGKTTVYDESKGLPDNRANAVVIDAAGTVWVGAGKGLMRFQNNQWKLYDSTTTPKMPRDIYELHLAADKTLWLGSGSGDLCQFDPAREQCVFTWKEPKSTYVSAITQDDQGNPIVGVGNGLWVYNGKDWKALEMPNDQLATNFVSAFANAPDGRLWISTDNGFHRIDPAKPDQKWETFDRTATGLKSVWAYSIAALPDGSLWFAIGNGNAAAYKNGVFTTLPKDNSYSQVAIAVDASGTVFLGSTKGLQVWNGQDYTTLTKESGLPSSDVRSLLADGDAVWIGTSAGLVKYQGGKIEVVLTDKTPGMPNPFINRIYKEKNGTLLLGTYGGLVRYDGKTPSLVFKAPRTSQNITGIAYDGKGRLWVSTFDSLYYQDGKDWRSLTTKDGLPSAMVNTIFADVYGTIWVGAGDSFNGGGLARIVP